MYICINISSELFLTIIVFSFIANLAKSIGSRGSKALSRQEIEQIAPSFLWLLRDAILEPVNSRGQPCHFRDYLLEKVTITTDITLIKISIRF